MPKKGYKQTEEHRKKTILNLMPGWNKDRKMPKMIGNTNGFKKGQKPWNRGLKGFMAREKNGRWKGGISKNRFYNRLCLFKRRNKVGLLKISIIQQVYEDNIKKYGTLTCYLCLKPIEFKQDCIEHKIPLSRGGTHSKDNLDIAHRSCNCKKHNKTEEEYRATERNLLHDC